MNGKEYRYQHLVRQDCPRPPGSRVVIYCRDSGGDDQDRSVQQQIDAAREYCDLHNLVIEREYIDEARASSNTEKRSQLRDMLADLRARFRPINDRYKRQKLAVEKPFGALFWKSNRLGRDSIEATHIKADLRLRAITIIDLVTSANTGNAGIDALIEAFQQYQDEFLLDELSDNIKRGLVSLVSKRDDDAEFLKYNPDWESTGAYLGIFPGIAPKGFKIERIKIGVHKRGRAANEARIVQRIVPDPVTWSQCRQAWEMRITGHSIADIHDMLHLFGSVADYKRFFSNRIYIGELEYGGAVYKDFVPAMIPREWFQAEQANIAERAEKLRGQRIRRELEPASRGNQRLLSGLVWCGEVAGEEHPMSHESIPPAKGKRTEYRFFHCNVSKRSKKTDCPSRRVNARMLEAAVVEHLLSTILTINNLRPIVNHTADALASYSEHAAAHRAAGSRTDRGAPDD